MIEVKELREAVGAGLAVLTKKPDVKEAEVFASANAMRIMRICYATNVPSNALEEPKSMENFGLGIRIAFRDGKTGFGKADSNISTE
ncbi:hypothetical protein KKH30_02390, partial [Candidatus Micrarchaeota archaeon]|nr:hypothetical protein [Candidatus Micrarchaeota archaeon]